LIGHGVAMAVAFIEPCGINLPHTHPRATEIIYVVSGTFEVGFFQENGARFISNTVTAGEGTIFPVGSIHFQQNLNCQPAVFVAGFDSIDPGVLAIGQAFFNELPADVVGANLGLSNSTVQSIGAQIPGNPALGILECRKRCGLPCY
jgi:quercetin dioxygenase-like cupin family protein